MGITDPDGNSVTKKQLKLSEEYLIKAKMEQKLKSVTNYFSMPTSPRTIKREDDKQNPFKKMGLKEKSSENRHNTQKNKGNDYYNFEPVGSVFEFYNNKFNFAGNGSACCGGQ